MRVYTLKVYARSVINQCLGDDISNVIQSQNEQIEQTAQEINKQAIEAKNKHPKAWKKYRFCN